MQITLNLTVVLVALIISVTLCVLYAMEAKTEKKNEEVKLINFEPKTTHSKRSTQEQGLMEYVEDRVKRGEGKE